MSTSMTGIAWTDRTWNPTRGCRRIPPGCGGAAGEGGCYAERQAYRFSGSGGPYEGLVTLGKHGPRWTGKGVLALGTLFEPLRWRTPAKIFVDSMSDLFFEGFSDADIDQVLAVMLLAPDHTFQVLTKRADRMRAYLSDPTLYERVLARADVIRRSFPRRVAVGISNPATHPATWIWWGVSVENQDYADNRLPDLVQTPAAIRFVSYEPALGPIDFSSWLGALQFVIVGGESGAGARPFDIQWARSVIRQCNAARVAAFAKQLGAHPRWNGISLPGEHWPSGTRSEDDGRGGFRVHLRDRKGADLAEWPEDLRVQEFPSLELTA